MRVVGVSACTLLVVAVLLGRGGVTEDDLSRHVAAGDSSQNVEEEGPSQTPTGNLAQLMRATFFTNANTIFDVQTQDPAAPLPESAHGETATSRFSRLYSGWPVVEHSAVALAEAANFLVLPGRLCENGIPAPVDSADWIQFAQAMEEAGRAGVQAAQPKNQEVVSEFTNQLAGACAGCHSGYRDVPGGKPERCKVT